MIARTGTLRRFAPRKIEVERSIGLQAGHAALTEGRTIFQSMVATTPESPRFLVSGHNNPKLGKTVLKGERAGMPIYHLTLEERATCPRSCGQWADCYGNAMPYARRHAPDEDFIPMLTAELLTLARAHRKTGLLIRLHALGDFYSVEYVEFWGRVIEALPKVHVFGYTARRIDDPDPETAEIAAAIRKLTERQWGRFAIRTSHAKPGSQRAVVVDEPPIIQNVILCPAQTEQTAACATCGLCWSETARDKTIAFLRHGMKRRRAA